MPRNDLSVQSSSLPGTFRPRPVSSKAHVLDLPGCTCDECGLKRAIEKREKQMSAVIVAWAGGAILIGAAWVRFLLGVR